MMISHSKILELATTAAMLSIAENSTTAYKESKVYKALPLTNKQQKKRAASKRAKQARRKNRK